MKRQNVTLALPADIIEEARHLAAGEGLSLSKYMARLLAEQVETDRHHRETRAHQQRIHDEGMHLGTRGSITWRREELRPR